RAFNPTASVVARMVNPVGIVELARHETARAQELFVHASVILLGRVKGEVGAAKRDPSEKGAIGGVSLDILRRFPTDPSVGMPLGRSREVEDFATVPIPHGAA